MRTTELAAALSQAGPHHHYRPQRRLEREGLHDENPPPVHVLVVLLAVFRLCQGAGQQSFLGFRSRAARWQGRVTRVSSTLQ